MDLTVRKKQEPVPTLKAAMRLLTHVFSVAIDTPEFQRQVASPNIPKFGLALIVVAEDHPSRELKVSHHGSHFSYWLTAPSATRHRRAVRVGTTLSYYFQGSPRTGFCVVSSPIQWLCGTADGRPVRSSYIPTVFSPSCYWGEGWGRHVVEEICG